MADPFLGEIRMFPFQPVPAGWAPCDGALLPIAQNSALFSVLGTLYGGDGRTTFGLPDLTGRAPMGAGHGPGLTDRRHGEKSGVPEVALTAAQLPAHTHPAAAASDVADTNVPGPGVSLARSSGGALYHDAADVAMAPEAVSEVGGGDPHTNLQPYLALNPCIAVQGSYPSRA